MQVRNSFKERLREEVRNELAHADSGALAKYDRELWWIRFHRWFGLCFGTIFTLLGLGILPSLSLLLLLVAASPSTEASFDWDSFRPMLAAASDPLYQKQCLAFLAVATFAFPLFTGSITFQPQGSICRGYIVGYINRHCHLPLSDRQLFAATQSQYIGLWLLGAYVLFPIYAFFVCQNTHSFSSWLLAVSAAVFLPWISITVWLGVTQCLPSWLSWCTTAVALLALLILPLAVEEGAIQDDRTLAAILMCLPTGWLSAAFSESLVEAPGQATWLFVVATLVFSATGVWWIATPPVIRNVIPSDSSNAQVEFWGQTIRKRRRSLDKLLPQSSEGKVAFQPIRQGWIERLASWWLDGTEWTLFRALVSWQPCWTRAWWLSWLALAPIVTATSVLAGIHHAAQIPLRSELLLVPLSFVSIAYLGAMWISHRDHGRLTLSSIKSFPVQDGASGRMLQKVGSLCFVCWLPQTFIFAAMIGWSWKLTMPQTAWAAGLPWLLYFASLPAVEACLSLAVPVGRSTLTIRFLTGLLTVAGTLGTFGLCLGAIANSTSIAWSALAVAGVYICGHGALFILRTAIRRGWCDFAISVN